MYNWAHFLRKQNQYNFTAGFLTHRSSSSRTFSDVPKRINRMCNIQWHLTGGLPAHSDRIVQDFHLIPYYPDYYRLAL